MSAMVGAGLAAAAALALTPAGGFAGPAAHGAPARFRVGAATVAITPPAAGRAPGGDPANCAHSPLDLGRAAVRLRGALRRPQPQRPLRPRRAVRRLQRQRALGRQPARRRRQRPAVLRPRGRPGQRPRDGGLATGGGRSPSRCSTRRACSTSTSSASAPAWPPTATTSTASSSRPPTTSRRPTASGLSGVDQTTSGVNDYWVNVHGRPRRAGDRAGRPGHAPGHDPLHRGARAGQPAPVLVLVSVRRRPAHPRAAGRRPSRAHDRHAGQRQPARRDARLQRRAPQAELGLRRLGRLLPLGAASAGSAGSAIEMAGAVGSVESPEVYRAEHLADPADVRRRQPPGRLPHAVQGRCGHRRGRHRARGDRLHRRDAGVRRRHGGADRARAARRRLRQLALGDDLGRGERASASRCRTRCSRSARRSASSPTAPATTPTARWPRPVAPNGASSGQALRSDVAAFQIGDGEFISVPGEVFPFTYLRGSARAARTCPTPVPALPPWLHPPHAHAVSLHRRPGRGHARLHLPGRQRGRDPDREPTSTRPTPTASAAGTPMTPSRPRPTRPTSSGGALVGVLDAHGGPPEPIVTGRYVLPGGRALARSARRPRDQVHGRPRPSTTRGRAVGVALAGGRVVHPRLWMSLSGLPQRRPDRDTRGYIDARGRRVWLNVF